jgi:predicted DNA-binding protein
VRQTFDPRTVKPGTVLFTTPGFNERKHRSEARAEHVARGKAAGWKWIRAFMSPELLARIDALRVRTKETREDIIIGGLTHALDMRDASFARQAKRAAANGDATKGDAA